jgi:hypothetical protein
METSQPTIKRAIIGMPYYDTVQTETLWAAQRSSARPDRLRTDITTFKGSVLPSSFNHCLIACLNAQPAYDYFAMLHADVVPDDFWLDTMIDELESHKVDFIHAVVAIKDCRGFTSTAIGFSDDKWAEKNYITTKQLQDLPDTFTVDALGDYYDPCPKILLPNTGCLVLRCGEWLRKFPGFEFSTRLRFDGKGFHAEVVGEDWNFGYWMAANGVKVAATKKVRTSHYGRAAFTTKRGWGDSSLKQIDAGQATQYWD